MQRRSISVPLFPGFTVGKNHRALCRCGLVRKPYLLFSASILQFNQAIAFVSQATSLMVREVFAMPLKSPPYLPKVATPAQAVATKAPPVASHMQAMALTVSATGRKSQQPAPKVQPIAAMAQPTSPIVWAKVKALNLTQNSTFSIRSVKTLISFVYR